ncbi:MAG: hypothetical protein IJU40_07645, partial [Desulfovibrionaceae bacterium]|nr:hypothetical protein [Desulfovibrionaceae bacterium]
NLTISQNIKPKSYWINTSSNEIIRDFLQHTQFNIIEKIQNLINKNSIKINLISGIDYKNLYISEDYFWNILYYTGYLTKVTNNDLDNNLQLSQNDIFVRIPNNEILELLKKEVVSWTLEDAKKYDT